MDTAFLTKEELKVILVALEYATADPDYSLYEDEEWTIALDLLHRLQQKVANPELTAEQVRSMFAAIDESKRK